MRQQERAFPSPPLYFKCCQCQVSLVSASSFAVCCVSSVGGGEFKAASHKSPDILILTGWSPVRRGFPLVLWVGVIVLWLLVSLWSTWERSILLWSPAVLQDRGQRREMLGGDAALCWGSCVGGPWLSGLLLLSLDINIQKKKENPKKQKDGLQSFWKWDLMGQRKCECKVSI